MRIALVALTLMLSVPAQAEVINQTGNAVIGGAGGIAHFGVKTGISLAHLGWNIATAPLMLIAPAPRPRYEARRYRRY